MRYLEVGSVPNDLVLRIGEVGWGKYCLCGRKLKAAVLYEGKKGENREVLPFP